MNKILSLSTFILAGVALTGCGQKVQYTESTHAKPLSTDFSFSDLNIIAQDMVTSMLTSPATVQMTQEYRPLIVVDRVRNETDQHINTQSITDTIRTQLIRSGKFRFTDQASRSAQKEEIEYQNYSGMVDQNKATAMGKQLGAEYMLQGAIVSYTERNKSIVRKSYKMTLNLINLQTGIIEWADEVPVNKQSKR